MTFSVSAPGRSKSCGSTLAAGSSRSPGSPAIIEMSRGPAPTTARGLYQPDEVPLALPVARIAETRDAARAAAEPGIYPYRDFVVWNGGQRRAWVPAHLLRPTASRWPAP